MLDDVRPDETEQLHIRHVGEPANWMPVASVIGRECPSQTLHGDALGNRGVGCHVIRIIVIDEFVMSDRRKTAIVNMISPVQTDRVVSKLLGIERLEPVRWMFATLRAELDTRPLFFRGGLLPAAPSFPTRPHFCCEPFLHANPS